MAALALTGEVEGAISHNVLYKCIVLCRTEKVPEDAEASLCQPFLADQVIVRCETSFIIDLVSFLFMAFTPDLPYILGELSDLEQYEFCLDLFDLRYAGCRVVWREMAVKDLVLLSALTCFCFCSKVNLSGLKPKVSQPMTTCVAILPNRDQREDSYYSKAEEVVLFSDNSSRSATLLGII
jgi:hypothetical protein